MIQKKKTWETLLVGWHTTSWVEKQGVGVGVGGDEEIRFLSFVCVLEIMGNSSISISISFFFQATVEWDWHWRIFVLSTGFCLKIEKGLNSLSCGNFFPLNHLCCMNDRATSLLVPESYNASTSVFQCPNIRIFWCWTWPKKEEWIDL